MESISSLNLLLVICAAALFVGSTTTLACDIDAVAQNVAQGPMPGGWFRVSLDDPDVVQLKMVAVEGENGVTKGVHVTEAYQQTVAGTNYCIRFSATGTCSAGISGHCQSMECVVAGHKALSSYSNQGAVSVTASHCDQTRACNFAEVSDSAKNPPPGGWSAEQLDNTNVNQLHEHASRITAVAKGRVTDAFRQTVSGTNFCIRFESGGSEDGCNAGRCSPLTCVAGGFLPLSSGNSDKPDPIRTVGVNCQGASLKGSSTLTACQLAAEAAKQPAGFVGHYVPQCDERGEYRPLQVHGSTGHQWCVDQSGAEMPGSRTPPGRPPPNCVMMIGSGPGKGSPGSAAVAMTSLMTSLFAVVLAVLLF
jgi:hypothetical protein